MREKLIDLIIDAKLTAPETGSFIEWLADYLIAYGVTISGGNCIGETVWGIWDVTNYQTRHGKQKSRNVHVCTLHHLDYVKRFGKAEVRPKVCTKSDMTFMGKTVFKTREEAERAIE